MPARDGVLQDVDPVAVGAAGQLCADFYTAGEALDGVSFALMVLLLGAGVIGSGRMVRRRH